MSLRIPAPLTALRHCFKVNSCRYPNKGLQSSNANRIIIHGTQRFTHRRAYTPVILQHATLSSPILPWLDKQHLETIDYKDGVMRIFSRNYATTTQMDEPGTSRAQTLLAAAPNPANLAPDEEIEILTEDEARLSMTERAAEKLSNIATLENDSNVSIRVAVESGGCHGYQYKLELTSEQAADDYRFVHPKRRNAAVLVDAVSLGLLKGSTLDYATELIGSSFRIIDNPQAKTSGCGCGISWEAKF